MPSAFKTRCEKLNSSPNAQHDLEALGLCGRQNVLGRVAVGCRVSPHEFAGSVGRDGVEVGLVVGLLLAAAVRIDISECEPEYAGSGHERGSNGKSDRGDRG